MYLFGMAEKNNWEDKAEKWIKGYENSKEQIKEGRKERRKGD